MEFNLNEPIAKRKTKTVYRDENKTIKLFKSSNFKRSTNTSKSRRKHRPKNFKIIGSN